MANLAPFTFELLPTRIIFGRGRLACLPDEVSRLDLRRVMVVSTRHQEHQALQVAKLLDGRSAGVFAGATMHTPVDVTEKAVSEALSRGADGIVAIGGGSTTGLSKAVSYRLGIPQIVVPTTYAGSEMTPILGETLNGEKTTFRDNKLLPSVVIYDVEQTMDLPTRFSVASGINAMAHAVEALYAKDRNPIVTTLAKEALAALGSALPVIATKPGDVMARENALYGACLCGFCLGAVGMALHHKLCHTIGGALDLPHAELHSVMLPYVVAYNQRAIPYAMAELEEAFDTKDVISALRNLLDLANLPNSLASLGMQETEIDKIAVSALQSPYWNPREIDFPSLRTLLQQAWQGELRQPA